MGSTENTTRLRDRLIELLLARRPASVLDVGCGHGELLERVRERDLPVFGVETSRSKMERLRAGELPVAFASAQALPFAARSFDWVTLRHVVHHLEFPARAVAEAARVARRGLVLAEPWRDPTREEQALSKRLDLWMKTQDRRLGHHHHDDKSARDLVGFLPADREWSVEVEQVPGDPARPVEEVRAELEPLTEGLDPRHRARGELAELLAEAERVGLGYTGSTIVIAERS